MEELSVLGRYSFVVDPFFVDKLGRLRTSMLCSQMINCASKHANARGFGPTETLGWVLARFCLQIDKMPTEHEEFFIETWVRNMYRGFTDRCFKVIDSKGNVCASALSTFAMLDLEKRCSVDLSDKYGELFKTYGCSDIPFAIDKIPALPRCLVKEPKLIRSPQYSDIDSNGHMNSMRYLVHLLDLLPLDYIYSHSLSEFTVGYMQEAQAGENLLYCLEVLGENLFYGQVAKENGQATCRCELKFKKHP